MRKGARGRAEASNLVGIYAALADTTRAAVLAEFGGKGWGVQTGAGRPCRHAPRPDRQRNPPPSPPIPAPSMPSLKDGRRGPRRSPEATMAEVRKIVGFVR